MRLGSYPCHLVAGTKAAEAYKETLVHERHRHRYEFNNSFRDMLDKAGLKASGISPDGCLVEICELVNHRWMLGVQFHPEFGSRPICAHLFFAAFIGQLRCAEGGCPVALESAVGGLDSKLIFMLY